MKIHSMCLVNVPFRNFLGREILCVLFGISQIFMVTCQPRTGTLVDLKKAIKPSLSGILKED